MPYSGKNLASLTTTLANLYVKGGFSLEDVGKMVGISGKTVRAYFKKYLPEGTELRDKVDARVQFNADCTKAFIKFYSNPPAWLDASDDYICYLFERYKEEKVATLFHVTLAAVKSKKYRLKEKLAKKGICL